MEEVKFIADSLGKKMSKINVGKQTDLDQLEVVSPHLRRSCMRRDEADESRRSKRL